MDATEIRKLLPMYADGELDPEQSCSVEAALAESAALRGELERWRALRRCACRAVASVATPGDLVERVRAVIPAPRQGLYRIYASVLAAAAVVVLAFFYWPHENTGIGGGSGGATPTVNARLVSADKFVEIHDYCAVTHKHDQLELASKTFSADDAKVADAVGFPVRVPDLRSAGFDLAGGCTCFQVQGTRAAHLFYRAQNDPTQMLSYFVVDCPLSLENCKACSSRCGTRHYEQVDLDGQTVLHWCENDHSYAVVGALDVERLDVIAGQVRVATSFPDAPALARGD